MDRAEWRSSRADRRRRQAGPPFIADSPEDGPLLLLPGGLEPELNREVDVTQIAAFRHLVAAHRIGSCAINPRHIFRPTHFSPAGTGADAIRLNATAGGIDVDANNAIAVNTVDGSISLSAGRATNGDITLSSADDITLNAADSSSLFFSDYATCGYLYTGGSGVLSCGGYVPADVNNVYWMASSDQKAIVEKNTTMDVLFGGSATASSKLAVTNMASGTPTLYAPNAAAIDFPEFDVAGATGSVTINDKGDLGFVPAYRR